MFPRIFAIGLLGLAPLLGSGCSGQSSNLQAPPREAGASPERRSEAPTDKGAAEKDAKTKQITLAVTGMT